MDSATERLLEYAGKRRNQVSNPCLTANQAIAVANDIQSLQRERDALRVAAQAVLDRWDSPAWTWDGSTAELIGKMRTAMAGGPAQ